MSAKYKNMTGQAAVNGFVNDIDNTINEIKKIPNNFYPWIANKVRNNFRINFLAKEGWKNPHLKPSYAKRKDRMLERGDTFKYGVLGSAPVRYGSEVFGLLTGTMASLIGTASTTSTRTEIKHHEKSTVINIGVGIDATDWGEETVHEYIPEKKGVRTRFEVVKKTIPGNALIEFSKRVTPAGKNSIFVNLTNAQKNELEKEIEDKFMAGINAVVKKYHTGTFS